MCAALTIQVAGGLCETDSRSETTLMLYFRRKAGFGKTDATVRQFDCEDEDDLPLSVFATMGMMRRAAKDFNVTSDQNLDEFIKIDYNTPTEDDDPENQTTTSSQVSEANETDGEIEHVQEKENKIKCFKL
ncbi:hypothetical protein QE152_g5109 [Popillia japonica]|uniref:Uncharacterized protein n=1 Tax=Popillia japonica TaxID=7064 RepID=A0AAW1MXL0_POPJA